MTKNTNQKNSRNLKRPKTESTKETAAYLSVSDQLLFKLKERAVAVNVRAAETEERKKKSFPSSSSWTRFSAGASEVPLHMVASRNLPPLRLPQPLRPSSSPLCHSPLSFPPIFTFSLLPLPLLLWQEDQSSVSLCCSTHLFCRTFPVLPLLPECSPPPHDLDEQFPHHSLSGSESSMNHPDVPVDEVMGETVPQWEPQLMYTAA